MNAVRNFKKVSSSCHNNVHYSNIHEHTLINTYHFVYLLHVCLLFKGTYIIAGFKVYTKHRETHAETLTNMWNHFAEKLCTRQNNAFEMSRSARNEKWKVELITDLTSVKKKTVHIYARQKMNICVLCGCICLTENTYTHGVFYVSANEHVTCNISISMHHESWLVP